MLIQATWIFCLEEIDTHSLTLSILLAVEIPIVAAISSNVNITWTKNPQKQTFVINGMISLYLNLG